MPRFLAPVCSALVAMSLGGLVPEAKAVIPLKPTGLSVSLTKAFDADSAAAISTPANPITALSYDSYLIRWTDNSFDEEGFKVEFRAGNIGPFSTLQFVRANTDSFVAVLPRFPATTLLQFQVGAYKFNGANVEYANSALFPYTLVDGTSNFGAPTGLTAELVGDGVIKLKWADNSSNEVYHQLLYKKNADTNYTSLGYIHFNLTEIPLQLGLKPGGEYDFRVRATRKAPADGVTFTVPGDATVHATNTAEVLKVLIPALAAPTDLQGEVVSESSVKLSWTDNSTNETGYQIEYRPLADANFTTLGAVNPNTTSVTVPTPPATTVEWRVRAIYKTTEVTTAIESAPTTPSLQLSTLFPSPSNLVAVTSPKAGSVDLTWKDNSTSEAGFDILTRPNTGSGTFTVALSVPAGTTTATVSQRLNSAGSAYVPLELNASHEFVVRAYYGEIESADSNSATANAEEGFTSRFYQPATVGETYNSTTRYQLTTSPAVTTTGGAKNWNISGLSEVGLSFENDTGYVTGTPTKHGVFTFPMTASFSDGTTANGTLTLRIMRPRAAPTSQDIANTTIAPKTTLSIPLASKFADPESEAAVRFETTKGNIDILLYPSLAPQAVDNFLAYVNAGDYNGVVFHRSVTDVSEDPEIPDRRFVIQAGAFKPVATPKSYETVASRPSPLNEPGISNLMGTISAAKQGNNQHSATHDFFLNLNDNNSSDPQSLDNQNGGFTVFGRVATTQASNRGPLPTTFPVLETIAALPIGRYYDRNNDNPSGTPYDDALDKRVLIDGSPASFVEWPMNVTGSAPLDMNVLQNVFIEEAYQIPVLDYDVTNSATDIVTATVVNGNLQLTGVKAGTATIAVKVTDLEDFSATETFTVTVTPNHKGPVITAHPVSVAVAPGAKASFSVTATGTAITYQWRKEDVNGVFQPILGATTKTLALTGVGVDALGRYDVLVTNATTTLTSNPARLDFKAAPTITDHPEPTVVNVGQPLELAVEVAGAPAPVVSWRRGTTVVAGQTKPQLKILSAKLTDGGIYTARATNTSGPFATSNPANVYVVDTATVVTTLKVGGKVSLKAAVSGPGLTYQWRKNGAAMGADDDRITGKNSATLNITNAAFTDSAAYTCEATPLGGLDPIVTGIQKVAVVLRPIAEDDTAPTGVVGFDYDYTVAYDDLPVNTPSSFAMGTLPPGLTLNTKTGRITGRPIKAGTYRVAVVLSNVVGSSNTAYITFNIVPMSQYAVGSFVGAIQPSALNGNKGGRIDLTTLDVGSYTGRIVLGPDSYSIAGKLTYFPGVLYPQSQIIVPRTGKTPVLLTFGVDETDGDLVGSITDGAATSTVNGFRQFWNTFWNPSGFFAGNYNMAISLKSTDTANLNNPAVPQGAGYATMIATLGGTALITVRMPDGVALTTSSIVGPRGQFLIYQMLYKNTGSIQATPSFGTTNLGTGSQPVLRISGQLGWVKDNQTATAERNYKAGFGPLAMDVIGLTYRAPTSIQPPIANTRVMELPPVTNNARLDFSNGGLTSASIHPDVMVTVPANNVLVLPVAGSVDNPGKVKVTVYPASGLYSGSFELNDLVAGKPVKRTVPFQGVVIPKIPTTPGIDATDTTDAVPAIPGSNPYSPGYFLLPQLASTTAPITTATTSPILSGLVEFKPLDITVSAITTSPVATTVVNPGTAYSFSVTATGQGTLTYQWRKGEVNISGATSATYSIPSVAEAHQGEYDVVVSNGSISATSTKATLTVNDPITAITITRSPTGSTVSTGQSVSFTAEPQGTGPFTYQWYKEASGDDIALLAADGGTSKTYTIASASAALHDGTYYVKVTSAISSAGVASGTISLTVVEGVSNVVASRTPASSTVAAGNPVTFTVTAQGAGTLSYQWRKNDVAINQATSATYTINSPTSGDNGTYTVLVTSAATPSGVVSNGVSLTVSDLIINVTASRTPSAETVPVGETVTLTVAVDGQDPSYQWLKDGTEIPGAISQSYIFTASMLDNNAVFTVRVVNSTTPGGVLSNGVPIKVAEPIENVMVSQSPPGTIIAPSAVTLTVSAEGTDPQFQWRKGGSNIDGATGNTYTIATTTANHSGDYDCVVTNAVSTVNSSIIALVVSE